MPSSLFQITLLLCAGAGLFLLWRRTASLDLWVRRVVAGGFLVRAFLGQLLFWISYLDLPYGRSMQIGNGLWFFARDAAQYLPQAVLAAQNGPWAIILHERRSPSISYVQVLASAVLLLGDAASVAVLLNLFCYLGMVLILVRWSTQDPRVRTAAIVAITILSLSPAPILWSAQPLKDVFFQFLVVACVGACAAWQRWWMNDGRAWAPALSAAAITATLFLISGVRWYYGFALLVASSGFLLIVAIASPRRKLVAMATSAVLLMVLSRAFLYGAGPYVPISIRGMLEQSQNSPPIYKLPAGLAGDVEKTRRNFERTGGTTQIGVGSTWQKNDETPPSETARGASKSEQQLPAKPLSPPGSSVSRPDDQQPLVLPASRIGRFVTGTAATVLPRSIAQRLGIVRIDGRGAMWWFTEADTFVFECALLWAALMLLTRPRAASLRNPLFWLIASVTLVIGVLLVYSVTNYGTLFRLRGMIHTGLLLIPIALAAGPQPRRALTDAPTGSPAPEIAAADPRLQSSGPGQ